jgi:PII-like signaling protein
MDQNENNSREQVSSTGEMSLHPALKLTVFIGGDERRSHHPLIDDVLRILHETGLAGATVTKGVMSYGTRRRIHSTQNEMTMDNLPLIIEAVGEAEMIRMAGQTISALLGKHGLVELLPTTMICRVGENATEQKK